MQMPPCSSLNFNPRNITCTTVNFDNPLVQEEELYEDLICLDSVRPEVILILQQLVICSDAVIAVLNKSINVDQIKSVEENLNQCSSADLRCTSSNSSPNEKVLLSCCNSDQTSTAWSVLPESREALQHGMAQHDSGAENDETPNDSGFHEDSGGLQRPLSPDRRVYQENLEQNDQELLMCCFYFRSIDSLAAKNLLRKKPTGTFLIRDSSHSDYRYSLSVKTERGATSVRIIYNGLFQFDSDERIRSKLPQFESVMGLLDFHVMNSREGVNKFWQWEEASGRKGMKVTLTKPLMSSVPSLTHLSRVKINQCLDNSFLPHQVNSLPLISARLKEFMKEYPYRI